MSSNRSNRSSISAPFDIQHVTHITFDDESGRFYGSNIPEHWKEALQIQGISLEEQEEHATATALVLKFYEETLSGGRPSMEVGSLYARVSLDFSTRRDDDYII